MNFADRFFMSETFSEKNWQGELGCSPYGTPKFGKKTSKHNSVSGHSNRLSNSYKIVKEFLDKFWIISRHHLKILIQEDRKDFKYQDQPPIAEFTKNLTTKSL